MTMKYRSIWVKICLVLGFWMMQSCDPKDEVEEELEDTITEIENSEQYTDVTTSMSTMTGGLDQLFGSTSSGPGNGRFTGSEECLPDLVVETISEDGSQATFTLDFSSVPSDCAGLELSGVVSFEVTGYVEVETVEVPDVDGMPGDVIEKDVVTTLDMETASMSFTDFSIENRTVNGTLELSHDLVNGNSQMTLMATNLEVSNESSGATITFSESTITYDWDSNLTEEDNPLETDFVLNSTSLGTRTEDGETTSFTETTTDADVVSGCFDEDIFIPQDGMSTIAVGDQNVSVDYSSGGSSCNAVVTLTTTVNGFEIEEEINLAD